MRFRDRTDAGRQLAAALSSYAGERPIVLALPRGGVLVGAEVARALGAPLDVLVVRKLGAPFQPELGIGAVAEGGGRYVDEGSCQALGIRDADVAAVAALEEAELERRVQRYRDGQPLPELADRTVILVDDGVATGGTARAALAAVRARRPRRVVFAVPVAPPETVEALRREADDVVAVQTPEELLAIGYWYHDFRQVTDEEVRALLGRSEAGAAAGGPTSSSVTIPAAEVMLDGDLTLPPGARGVVLFAHGSGSSRFSPRNRFVAATLGRAGLGTLLFDLLTAEEEAIDAETAGFRFDIDLLAARLVAAIDWVAAQPATRALGIGCFGSSTGAAATLIAAAVRPHLVAAVVSRGGRPDLADAALHSVRAPTLLIVGGEDYGVIELNERALELLRCEKQLVLVPGATHLFEEPGALEAVAHLAAAWFARHLAAAQPEAHPG